MAAWRYEISLLVLKNMLLVPSLFLTFEEKFLGVNLQKSS